MITIFTPTYNRAYRLPDLYLSLQEQTCKDFEWLVVDDGSTDNTSELFEQWQAEESSFPIRYFKQSNGGKHRAINRGVKEAKGELFFIVDSDDKLTLDAISSVQMYGDKIMSDPECCGIVGMKIYPDGKRVGGNAYFEEIKCSRFDFRYKYKINGDLAEVYKTSVLQEFPFPEYEGEKFCPEGCVWITIAMKYDLYFFNKGIYICEYLEDGLTTHIDQVRIKSPLASSYTYAIEFHSKVPISVKIKDAINYWRFRFHCHDKKDKSKIALWAMPIGWLFYKLDCKKYPEICKK